MIHIDEATWKRLYVEVLLWAKRATETKDWSQAATNVDRAREATQQAFSRFLKVRPAELRTLEEVRAYLMKSVRSALSHGKREQERRATHTEAAAVEAVVMGEGATASAEAIHLQAQDAEGRRQRAVRIIARLRAEVAGDPIVLGTIDCIERGEIAPADQARTLGKSVEEIYAARKRRKRAAETVAQALDHEEETS